MRRRSRPGNQPAMYPGVPQVWKPTQVERAIKAAMNGMREAMFRLRTNSDDLIKVDGKLQQLVRELDAALDNEDPAAQAAEAARIAKELQQVMARNAFTRWMNLLAVLQWFYDSALSRGYSFTRLLDGIAELDPDNPQLNFLRQQVRQDADKVGSLKVLIDEVRVK
jgi:hypothetical protein